MYSYGMNDAIGENVTSGQVRTKIAWWRSPSRKILLTEVVEKYNTAPVWDYGTPLAWRHGTGRFRGNVPGFPDLSHGATVGVRASAAFIDGHAEGIDQDFAFNEIQIHPEAR